VIATSAYRDFGTMRIKLTQDFVNRATCPAGKDREVYWDVALKRFGLMVTERGHKSFVLQYHNRSSESRRLKIDGFNLSIARKEAEKYIGEIAAGVDPLARIQKVRNSSRTTVKAICEDYFHASAGKLRSLDQRRSAVERLVYGQIGSIQVAELKWSRVRTLLHKIEREQGPAQADTVKAFLSRIFHWHENNSDDFKSPIVKGERFNSAQPRERTLTDNEIQAVWRAAENCNAPWGHFIRFLLLTGARRNEAAKMEWAEVTGDVWTIPGARYKTKNDVVIPLSKQAHAALNALPRIEGCRYTFSGDGKRPIGGFSSFKREFDKTTGLTGWRLHDLRRTARSLLSRAGVSPDTAERCLGHVIGGIRGTYDKHDYAAEKRQAFEALAALLKRIINPQENVLTFGGKS
jgi:integrase